MSYDFDLPHAGGNLANGAGVWPTSSPEQYVIFSIDRPHHAGSFETELACGLSGVGYEDGRNAIGFKRLVGHYTFRDGREIDEPAWIINARDWRKLAASGWIDGQESVLHLGPYENGGRPAALVYRDTIGADHVRHWVDIGTFTSATEARAKREDAWTFDPTTGEYFICQ